MNNYERDILIGAGIEGYRAYQATGDRQIATKAAVSGGLTIFVGARTRLISAFSPLIGLADLFFGAPVAGFIFVMLSAAMAWITVTLLMAHTNRMKRYMAPQPIPAPPGLPPPTPPRGQGQPPGQEGLQYTYDLRTGQF